MSDPGLRPVAAFGYCLLGGVSVAVAATIYVVRHVRSVLR